MSSLGAILSSLAARLFGIDPRALAAFRVAVALLLAFDLLQRAGDFGAFFADGGVLSVAEAANYWVTPGKWSLHWWSPAPQWQAGLLVVAAAAAGALLLGWRTTAAAIVSWVLLVSRQERMPITINGGDWLLRLLLFWSCWLPLGCCWSLDARRRPSGTNPVVSAASAAIVLQLALMYFFSGLWKWNDIWLDGEALVRAVKLQTWVRPFGRWLGDWPEVLRWLSWSTMALECVGPWLLFVPWRTNWFRAVMTVSFVAMHLGIELCMSVGYFSYVAFAGWLLILPPDYWNWLARRVPSLAVVEREAPQGAAWRRRLAGSVCGALLLFVIAWNTLDLLHERQLIDLPLPRPVRSVALALHLEQQWSMFSRPSTFDGWYVVRASLRDDRLLDLLRQGRKLSHNDPGDVYGSRQNQRWQKLFHNLTLEDYAEFRDEVARYFARQWNDAHPHDQQAVLVRLIYYQDDKAPEQGLTDIRPTDYARLELGAPHETDDFAEQGRERKLQIAPPTSPTQR